MKITQKKIEAILSLPGPQRYSHFIKVAADQNKVWGLFFDGWALAEYGNGQKSFPIWPAYEYAALCCAGDWSRFEPRAIDLDSFFDELIPSLKRKNTVVSIFLTPTDKAVLPSFDLLEANLRDELQKIE